MNDVSGRWIPENDEDGIESALELFRRNVWYRFLEQRTRLEDKRLEIPVAEVKRRLVETGQ